jgi:M-phase inducer tyrosine phosphatase
VDCRFDYEYQSGHILDAVNLNGPEAMKDYFFKDRETVERLMQTVIVFHCEFSQKRGPEMYSAVRELDRRLHINCYPQLFYPEIYILEGGYKLFHEVQPALCIGTYLPMKDTQFKTDCKEHFSNHQRKYKHFCSKKAA